MSTLNYADLKTAFASVPNLTWPTPTKAQCLTIYPPTQISGTAPTLSLSSIEAALSNLSGVQMNSFDFTSGLPDCFQSIETTLKNDLSIKQILVGVGNPISGANGTIEYPVNGFSFELQLTITPNPTVGDLTLDNLVLELNFVCLSNSLVWNALLTADCTFCNVGCKATIGLTTLFASLELDVSAGVPSPDTILGGASSGMSLSSLQSNMGVTPGNKNSAAVDSFTVTADLSAGSPAYQCALVLNNLDLKWHAFDLESIAINFEYTSGSGTSFTIESAVTIGGVTLDAILEKSSDSISLSGKALTAGVSVTNFLESLGSQLGITNPPALPDLELTTLSFQFSDTSGALTINATCGGSLALDASGTSFLFTIAVAKAGGDLTVTLNIGSLELQMSDNSGTYIFSSDSSTTLKLSELVNLLRLDALNNITNDIVFDIAGAFLALKPGAQPDTHQILFGLSFDVNANLNNPILSLIASGNGVGLKDATLLAANANWSAADLSDISGGLNKFKLPGTVSAGPSFTATLAVGSSSVYAPLSPSTQASDSTSSSSGASTTPAPKAVTSSSAAHWFDVQKQVGPIYLDKAGFALISGSGGSAVDLLCDASFLLGPITITLDGFSVSFPVTDFAVADIDVSLQGMNLAYNKPPLLISGGFLHTKVKTTVDNLPVVENLYIGDASIETESLFLSAFGEYAKDAEGNTSLALFAALHNPPLGGPVFCFVTGLAAGFGYNSQLNIPQKASDVAAFELIKAASPLAPGAPPPDPMTVITACINPMQGEDWLAVGILFRSFELVQSTALLTVAFGHELQFAILGQSEMSIPPDSTKPIAYTQVDVEATYSPSQGALEVYGVLSPNSYVLSTSCHLTGGFAYILKDSGNFVLTFGGYAPLFNYAALNYPAVPRLQILWQVDDHTCIKGDEYFALTPAVMMAGGSLQATWSCGIFAAWFTVDVNMFMQWKPFYYEAGFSMSLGVSFDLRILFVHIHFTFHVGAALQVEGPPFHGTAHIDLSVISFTVDFGPSAGGPSPLDWSHFRNMLPAGGVVSVINTINTETESPLLATKVTGGLVKDLSQKTTKQPTDPDWVVNGTHFEFALHTSLPITEASTNPISTNENPISPVVTVAETPLSVTGGVGILPMGITCINGTLDVVLTGPDGVIVADTDATSPLVVEAIIVDMAPAHWATSQPTDANTAPLPMTGGYRIYGGRPDPDTTVPVSVSTLLSQPVCITAVSNRPASAQPF